MNPFQKAREATEAQQEAQRIKQWAWNPLDKACNRCSAKPGFRCTNHLGYEIDTHRSRG